VVHFMGQGVTVASMHQRVQTVREGSVFDIPARAEAAFFVYRLAPPPLPSSFRVHLISWPPGCVQLLQRGCALPGGVRWTVWEDRSGGST
jgi:hypothetical protein